MKNFFLFRILVIFGFCSPLSATELIEGVNSVTLPMTCPQNSGEYYNQETSEKLGAHLESLDKSKITTVRVSRYFFVLNDENTEIEIVRNVLPTGITFQEMINRIEKASSFFNFSDITKLTLLSGQGIPGKTSHLQFDDTNYGQSWRDCAGKKDLLDKKIAKKAFEDLTWVTSSFQEHMKRKYPFLKADNILRSILSNSAIL